MTSHKLARLQIEEISGVKAASNQKQLDADGFMVIKQASCNCAEDVSALKKVAEALLERVATLEGAASSARPAGDVYKAWRIRLT